MTQNFQYMLNFNNLNGSEISLYLNFNNLNGSEISFYLWMNRT